MLKQTEPLTAAADEFELVLGNKQLLSVFFIVVILLGVFFTMGYILGRNSGAPETASRRPSEIVSDTSSGTAHPMPRASGAAPAATVEPVRGSDGERASTQANPTTERPVPPESSSSGTAMMVPKSARAPVETRSSANSVIQPVPGLTYLQVLAVGMPEAEVLVEVLSKKGFHAIIAPGPNDKLFRVLVGPAKDAGEVGKLKGDLQQAGFEHAFPKKY